MDTRENVNFFISKDIRQRIVQNLNHAYLDKIQLLIMFPSLMPLKKDELYIEMMMTLTLLQLEMDKVYLLHIQYLPLLIHPSNLFGLIMSSMFSLCKNNLISILKFCKSNQTSIEFFSILFCCERSHHRDDIQSRPK